MKEETGIKRPKYPSKKDVLLVVDMPTREEIEKGTPFFSSSNLNLITSLRTGRVSVYNTLPVLGWEGIKLADMATTYVDYTFYGGLDNNYDYIYEMSRRYTEGFIPFRDIYISPRLDREIKDFYNYIDEVNPKLILLTGKWGVYFMSEEVRLGDNRSNQRDTKKPLGSLTSYRGSVLLKDNRIIFPFYHPRNAIAMPEQGSIIEMDIQKAGDILHNVRKDGVESYKLNHTYHIGDDGIVYLKDILSKLDNGEKLTINFDIETFFYKTPGASVIDCIGFSHSSREGCCIAFCSTEVPSLYTLEEEQEIMGIIFQVMTHSNVTLCGQNAVAFDMMVILGRWLFLPQVKEDTLIMQNILYDFLPKELAFLASIYCKSSSYWKGEIGGDTRWVYNVKDCIYTYEVMEELQKQFIGEDKLVSLYRFTMDRLVPATVRTMRQGVRIDLDRKEELKEFFITLNKEIEASLCDAIGMEFNLNSGKQKQKILDFLGVIFKMKRQKGKMDKVTLDGDAMISYMEQYPLLRPFISLLLEYTAINKFSSTFLSALPDEDNRMRTQYKVAGTNTGRLASSKNAFGRAMNLQNLPKKGKLDLKAATKLLKSKENSEEDASEEEYLSYSLEGNLLLPNVKKMFLPEPGYELMDADLSGADARVVAWDSGCRFLLDFFHREEGKLYAYIASHHLQREITAKSPEYHKYKTICHGCLVGEHEVLTLRGWITIKDYMDGGHLEKIFVWNPYTKSKEELYMDYPLDVYKGKTDILYKVTGLDGHDVVYQQVVTENHKFYAIVGGKPKVVMAKELAMGMSLPYLTQQGHWQLVKLGHNAVQRMASPGTDIYCFTTSTGYFLTRYKGHIMPTGNSNYGMGLDKLAKVLNISLEDAKSLQRWYFSICPEIPRWHKRNQDIIDKRGYIENIFGRKRWFIDKRDVTRYNKAHGFIGQSTVADAMNIAWVNVDSLRLSYQIELLTLVMMQVHDSLVTQYPIEIAEEIRPKIIEAMEVKIPYKSPLVIPVDYKVSRVSYGDV